MHFINDFTQNYIEINYGNNIVQSARKRRMKIKTSAISK